MYQDPTKRKFVISVPVFHKQYICFSEVVGQVLGEALFYSYYWYINNHIKYQFALKRFSKQLIEETEILSEQDYREYEKWKDQPILNSSKLDKFNTF